MSLIIFVVISALIFFSAYIFMGAWITKWMGLKDDNTTPAFTRRDGLDFEPIGWKALLPQHFSAISAAGPIVGPILAGTLFGWGPTWLWIIFGSIFIGGIHDFTTLVASVRHSARSVAEIVKQYINQRAYKLFLIFIWLTLIYVIIAFADVTAGAFVQTASTEDATAPGPAVATSSILYLLLAVFMGFSMRSGLKSGPAKAIFLPLVLVAILAGPFMSLDLEKIFPGHGQKLWNYLLLAYCFIASITPVWLLLQPRGELGGYFLYFIMILGFAGILIGGLSGGIAINAPAFSNAPLFFGTEGVRPIFPILFITVACGACSGFHSVVSSGTTSKQLSRESDARPVAYGGMLLEGLFACLSLAAVMILVEPKGKPDVIYANGISNFLNFAFLKTVPTQTLYQFALLCFATFIFDTLDACTRLARYILMELTGWTGRRGIIWATVITLVLPVLVVSLPSATLNGKEMPLWRVFWNLFGSSNQLLAALALLAVAVWLRHIGKHYALPLFGFFFMCVMTLWSLILTGFDYYKKVSSGSVAALYSVEAGVAAILMVLAVWLAAEAFVIWKKPIEKIEPLMDTEL